MAKLLGMNKELLGIDIGYVDEYYILYLRVMGSKERISIEIFVA